MTMSYRIRHLPNIIETEIMSRIRLLILLCLFAVLNNAENSQLLKTKILSRLRKQSSISSRNPPVTRQLHRCYTGCIVIASFNDSLVLPNSCQERETNNTCEMTVILDYASQEILLYGFMTSESLAIQNTTYDSATSHLVVMAFNDSTILHGFTYICATGDYCEWKEMQEIIPKLIALNYQPLYNLLLPTLFNSHGRPNVIECYVDTDLVNCTTGICRYQQYANDDYQLETIRDCTRPESDGLEFEIIRHFPGPSKYDYSTVTFLCDHNQCNDQSKEQQIRQILSSNGNEYIMDNSSSPRINLSWSILNFHVFFCVIIIRYL